MKKYDEDKNMKLLNFYIEGKLKLGVKTADGVLDVDMASKRLNIAVPLSMGDLIADSDEGIAALSRLIELSTDPALFIDEKGIIYAPAATQPEKILCIGLNYARHMDECKLEDPGFPVVFSKFNNSLAAHKENIKLPYNANQFDYEVELVIVIGKTASNVTKEDALDHVFGYTIGNDLSARDLQFRTHQWLLGKTCDGFAPIGPYIVTADEISPNNLDISCMINGETRQHANTGDMIFSCASIISYLSSYMTLKPGDVIFTGTPSGVVLGYPEESRTWLKSGDVIVMEIENIGRLQNTLV
jgi:2-keto-4-pentenoate hydratase/2-oxohepta-3-ene-1,7-dioic acid hydratase in catechol pathway